MILGSGFKVVEGGLGVGVVVSSSSTVGFLIGVDDNIDESSEES